jgi:hypothetical protein
MPKGVQGRPKQVVQGCLGTSSTALTAWCGPACHGGVEGGRSDRAGLYAAGTKPRIFLHQITLAKKHQRSIHNLWIFIHKLWKLC